MAQRISDGKLNLDLYKENIVKALKIENDLKNVDGTFASAHKIEQLVQFYLEAASVSSSKMLGSEYTHKALFAAYDSVANFAQRMSDSNHFDALYKLVLDPLKIKALERRDMFPGLAKKYFDICLKLGECYKSPPLSALNAAAAFREAALFFSEANFAPWSAAKVDPRAEAYDILFESGDYLSAADWAMEAGMDSSKVSAAAAEAYNTRFKSGYTGRLEEGLDIAKKYNLGTDKIETIGKKLCKILEGAALEKEKDPIGLATAGYYHSQVAFYAKKAGLEDMAKESAIKACQTKFKAAEDAEDDDYFDLKKSSYLFIIDVAKTYDLDKETTFLAQEKLNKLEKKMDAQRIERENRNKASADLLFNTWFVTKRD